MVERNSSHRNFGCTSHHWCCRCCYPARKATTMLTTSVWSGWRLCCGPSPQVRLPPFFATAISYRQVEPLNAKNHGKTQEENNWGMFFLDSKWLKIHPVNWGSRLWKFSFSQSFCKKIPSERPNKNKGELFTKLETRHNKITKLQKKHGFRTRKKHVGGDVFLGHEQFGAVEVYAQETVVDVSGVFFRRTIINYFKHRQQTNN